jgi:type VI secretion system protein
MLKQAWIILIFLALAACASNPNKPNMHTKLIALDVMPTANLNHPIALDLVVVYNRALLEELLKITAKEWFEKRQQYKLDNPGILQSWEWELVPGQVVPFFKLPPKTSKGVGGIVFANYVTPGTHRARIDAYEGAIVRLKETEFLLLPLQ